jgi:hypothetical protein
MKLLRRIIPAITLTGALSSCGGADSPGSANESDPAMPASGQTVIALSPDLVNEVRTGRETATIRKGRKEYVVGPAVFEAKNTKIPIMITALQYKRFQDLDDEDAKFDGDVSKDELKASLKTYYPTMENSDEVTIVHFKVIGEKQP